MPTSVSKGAVHARERRGTLCQVHGQTSVALNRRGASASALNRGGVARWVALEAFGKGTVGHVLADAAYDSNAIRQQAKRMKAKVCIRPNPTRKVKKRYDRLRYRNLSVIERFFCLIKRYRRVVTRYEKKAANFAGFAWLAAFMVKLV